MDAEKIDLIARLLAVVLSMYGVWSGYRQWRRGQLPVLDATARKTDAETTLTNQHVTRSIADSASVLLTAGDTVVKNLVEQVTYLSQQVERFSEDSDKRERLLKEMQEQNAVDKALIVTLQDTIRRLEEQLAAYQNGDRL